MGKGSRAQSSEIGRHGGSSTRHYVLSYICMYMYMGEVTEVGVDRLDGVKACGRTYELVFSAYKLNGVGFAGCGGVNHKFSYD